MFCKARIYQLVTLTLSQLFRVTVEMIVKHPIVQFPKIQAHFKLFLLKSCSSKFSYELKDLKGDPLFQIGFFPFLVPRPF